MWLANDLAVYNWDGWYLYSVDENGEEEPLGIHATLEDAKAWAVSNLGRDESEFAS